MEERLTFLDEEASKIVYDLTNKYFAEGEDVWYYFLVNIELMPGTWCCTIYLEGSDYEFTGFGTPSQAVKEAYADIDKKWLKKGWYEGKKSEYFIHFMQNPHFWPSGVTKKRLERAEKGIEKYKALWDDVLIRHDGLKMSPIEIRDSNRHIYDHCMGNMGALVRQYMHKEGIIK